MIMSSALHVVKENVVKLFRCAKKKYSRRNILYRRKRHAYICPSLERLEKYAIQYHLIPSTLRNIRDGVELNMMKMNINAVFNMFVVIRLSLLVIFIDSDWISPIESLINITTSRTICRFSNAVLCYLYIFSLSYCMISKLSLQLYNYYFMTCFCFMVEGEKFPVNKLSMREVRSLAKKAHASEMIVRNSILGWDIVFALCNVLLFFRALHTGMTFSVSLLISSAWSVIEMNALHHFSRLCMVWWSFYCLSVSYIQARYENLNYFVRRVTERYTSRIHETGTQSNRLFKRRSFMPNMSIKIIRNIISKHASATVELFAFNRTIKLCNFLLYYFGPLVCGLLGYMGLFLDFSSDGFMMKMTMTIISVFGIFFLYSLIAFCSRINKEVINFACQ